MSQSNRPRQSSEKSKLWVYFKYCDDDPSKVRCILCSEVLSGKGASTVLRDHIKFKHSIDIEESRNKPSESIMTQTKPKRELINQRKNLDFIGYDEPMTIRLGPSSSISKNLISRLNQISSPVTRKLKFWNKKSFQVNQYDPSFKVTYLGNLGMQLWSKDESCLDKPLSTLWNNYLVNMKTEIVMRLTICNSGLKAITRQHGLTQYWSNRLVYCCSHKNYPRIFSWIYRHEGKKMRQELRCHAVLCPSPEKAAKMVIMLNQRLACALQEFRREKKSGGMSLVNNVTSFQQKLPRTVPLRRQILAKGSANFRPPLERSKSAPKLTSIVEEDYDSEESQNSHEEFEYEQSFGDRDDDSDYDEECEPGTPKAESNSLTTTVYDETSNGSIYATGDSSVEEQHKHRSSITRSTNQKINGGPVDQEKINRSKTHNSSSGSHESQNTDIQIATKEEDNRTENQSGNDKSSHINQETRQTSANTNPLSSLNEHVSSNPDSDKKDLDKFLKHEAKNNNTSNNIQPQAMGQADDVSQEIILSWSNFVIK